MNVRAIAFMLMLAAGLMLSGCITPITPEPPQKEPPKQDIIPNESIADKNATVKEPIIIGPCQGYSISEVDGCLYNISLCSHISSMQLKDQCYYNSANCTEILNESLRSECALKAKLAECEKEDNINLCKALSTGDPLYCGVNENCILKYSYEKGDDSTCSILDDYAKYACVAAARANYRVCYEMQYEASQKECLKLYASITGVDGNICSKISFADYREDCYKGVAENTLDYSNCLLIGTYKLHRECLSNVATNTGNATICEKLRQFYTEKEWQEDVDFCKTRVAQVNYKPQICQELKNTGYRQGCFGGSIVDGKVQKEDCDMIDKNQFPEWSDECYKRAAKE